MTITTILVLLTILTTDTVGQEQKVLHGITTDGYGNRLPVINVIIKGTTTGTITDACGRFVIDVDSDEITLFFHGLSYDDLRVYETNLTRADLANDTLVFQLGRWKVPNPDCDKVSKMVKKKVIR